MSEEKPGLKTGGAFSRETLLFLLATVAIILVTIYFRAPMLKFYGFYEPDGYYHYSVIRATVNDGFQVPLYLSTSGWPAHTTTGEPHGLYYVTLIPYYFLRYVGMNYYNIMRLIPVLFGILDVIGAYFLSRYLSKDKLFGLLVMLFVALNMGNAARTSALIYRGDSFVTPFLIASLIFAIEIFRTTDKRKKIAFMLISAFALSLCNAVWNGAPFATATYVFVLALVLLFGFVFEKKTFIDDSRYLLGALLVWFVLVNIYTATRLILFIQTFAGTDFFLLYAALLMGWYVLSLMLRKQFVRTATLRFAVFFVLAAIGVLAIYVVIPNFVYQIFTANGFMITSNFGATIQELQAPTPSFIFASFGLQILTPPGLLILLFTYVGQFVTAFWILLLATLLLYFYMQVYDSGGFAKGVARLNSDFSIPLIVILSFFALTAYLQMHAIRFNSLISVPLSILFAYTIYWLALYLKKHGPSYLLHVFYSVLIIATDVAFFIGITMSYVVSPLIIIFINALLLGYWLMMVATKYKTSNLTAYFIIVLLIAFMIGIDLIYINGLFPADNINPTFIRSLAWLRNNSASNSVVLTLWPDGSVVEGVANLTSVTDSVASQNVSKADPFAAWLFNSSADPQFLTSSINGKPDYLLVRSTWLLETGGIYTESNLTKNSSLFGYLPFTSLNEKVDPASNTQTFNFYAGGLQAQVLIKTENGTRSLNSYLISNGGINPFTYVAFYDSISGNYSVVRQTSFNQTNNQTFLIVYSDIPSSNLPVNITSAYMLTPDLAGSNMMQFLFFCSNYSCPWNNNVATLRLVYVNPDTKIFKITYNSTAT